MGPDAPSYVVRKADEELPRLVLAGQFCYVLTARQMGKSSLMVRTAKRLRAEGVRTATVELTQIGTQGGVEAWYLSLISQTLSSRSAILQGQWQIETLKPKVPPSIRTSHPHIVGDLGRHTAGPQVGEIDMPHPIGPVQT